jgi:hypothetical protein
MCTEYGFWFIDYTNFVGASVLPQCSKHCTAGIGKLGFSTELNWFQFQTVTVCFIHIE